MKLKILSLNLFRYYQDWEKRKDKIIKYINQIKPDVVLLQECFDDSRHNEIGNNQAIQLNQDLSYKNCIYSKAEKLKSEAGKEISAEVYDGLGILTNIDVISLKNISLTKVENDKHDRIIQVINLNVDGNKCILYHTHFSNRDFWAEPQLIETLEYANEEPILPIIIGDLNIKSSGNVLSITKNTYINSWDIEKYISFPKDNETYDYVLIPKSKYIFEKIVCDGDDLSDHKAVHCIINKKSEPKK
jgi:endonuclease/exonuclease/phosphatase family metal-dependent hydrolase